MIQVKQFSGIQNLDDQPDVIGYLQHMDAKNIVFRGTGANMRAQNIAGNVIIPNTALPTGTNVCIGAWYDQVKGRIFSFIFNSNNDHGIYIYTPSTNILQTLIKSNANTNGDVLRFDIQIPVLNVNIIYGDSTQGDILYWINSQKKPCKINIERALAGGYGVIQESFLDVAKEPPSRPPSVVYEDDATVTANTLRKRLFKFKTRYVFDDKEKSTTSIQSEIPLPYNPFDTDVDSDPTLNCRIAVVYQTGPANVQKIELLAAVSTGNQFSDFFLVASIDKGDQGLSDNDISVFNFYNDQAYNYIDIEESIQLFDYVPLQAYAQETLNGNVLIYGNITEGYPNLMNFSNSNVQFLAVACYEGQYFSLLVASQSGESGFGTGNTHVMVKGRVTQGNIYTIYYTDGTTTITYTALIGDTIADVLDGLIADATGKGFTITGSSATPNTIYFFKTNLSLAYVRVVVNGVLENINNSAKGSLMAYDWWSRYSYGLVYFDEKERANGAVYPVSAFAGQTIGYQDLGTQANIPQMNMAIYHRPPIWAVRYSIVRTKNISKSNFLQWISDRTFKDTTLDPNDQAFAYISIAALNAFITKNPSTPLGYAFTAGDRIRFIKLFNQDNSTAQLYANKDFEIQSEEINPTINGQVQTGQFIKIFLPDTDAAFDFGTSAYANYFIELYTPAQSVANGLDVYYEFGERYQIGNPKTVNAFHQGQFQNQSSDLFFPALFFFSKGDDYTRYRKVQTGIELNYAIPASACADPDAGRITIGATFVSESLVDPNITPGSSPCTNLLAFNPATDMSRYLIKIGTGTFNFRIEGAITIEFLDDFPGDSYRVYLQKSDLTEIELVPEFDVSAAGTYSFTFDTTFTMTSGQRVFIIGWSVPDNDHMRVFKATTFSITRTLAFTQTVIDPNFSDYYPSAVNSNGRAFVYDENAGTVQFPTLMRWGLSYEPDTNINRTNRFYAQNFDEIDLGKGAIERFKVRERIMRIFQRRGCGQVGIYTKFIQDSGGQQTLTTTDEIITKNNVNYYMGEYGVSDHPESLVSGVAQDYFVDPVRGYQVRLSNDGMTPISEIYKGQFYYRSLLTPYNKTWTRPDGSLAKILGVYDYLEEEFVTILQSGENGLDSISPYTFSFSERRNGYVAAKDYYPEWMVCAEDVLYAWLDGNLYVHNSNTYCNFFGVQFDAYIDVPFNQNLIEKKTWISLTEIANSIWECPLIYSNVMSYGTQRQETNLKTGEFRILEQMPSASFKRDIHSRGGKINGSSIKGNYIVIRFQVTNAAEFVYLSAISVKLLDSPLTTK